MNLLSHLLTAVALSIPVCVTAQEPAQSISVTPSHITLKNGETARLKATVLPANASQTVKWEADYSGEYTIDSDGNVTATFSSGDTGTGLIVSATTTDGTELTAYCTIEKGYSEPEALEILQPEITVAKGETAEITAHLLPDNGIYKSISWIRYNQTVGYGNSFRYTADNIGTDIITAIYIVSEETVTETEDGDIIITPGKILTADCTVNVTDALCTTISLWPSSIRLRPNTSAQLNATSYPTPFNRDYHWSSDRPDIATVNESGEVSAVADGTAVITVTALDGSDVSRSCEVTVLTAAQTDHPNTLRIAVKGENGYTLPLSEIDHITADNYTEGISRLIIHTAGGDDLKIPFADISEVSHIYDSGNGNTDATNPVITVVSSGNRLTVEGCDKTPMIEIYDLSGHLIHHERTDSAELPSGIYIVIVDKINIFKTKI